MSIPFVEPFRIKVVEPIKHTTRPERESILAFAYNNSLRGARRGCVYRLSFRFRHQRHERPAVVGDDGWR